MDQFYYLGDMRREFDENNHQTVLGHSPIECDEGYRNTTFGHGPSFCYQGNHPNRFQPGFLGCPPYRPVYMTQSPQLLSSHLNQQLPSYPNLFPLSHVAVGPTSMVGQDFNCQRGLLGCPPYRSAYMTQNPQLLSSHLNQQLPSYLNPFPRSHVAARPASMARQDFNFNHSFVQTRAFVPQLFDASQHFQRSANLVLSASPSLNTDALENQLRIRLISNDSNSLDSQVQRMAMPCSLPLNSSRRFSRSLGPMPYCPKSAGPGNSVSQRFPMKSVSEHLFRPPQNYSSKISGNILSSQSKALSLPSDIESPASPSPTSLVNTCVNTSSVPLDAQKIGSNAVTPMNDPSDILGVSSTTTSPCSVTPVSGSKIVDVLSTSSPPGKIALYSVNPVKQTIGVLNINSTDMIASSHCVTSTKDSNGVLSVPSAVAAPAIDVGVTIDFQKGISRAEITEDLYSRSLDTSDVSKGTFLEGDQNSNVQTGTTRERMAKSTLPRTPHGEDNSPIKAGIVTLSSIDDDDAKGVSELQNPSDSVVPTEEFKKSHVMDKVIETYETIIKPKQSSQNSFDKKDGTFCEASGTLPKISVLSRRDEPCKMETSAIDTNMPEFSSSVDANYQSSLLRSVCTKTQQPSLTEISPDLKNKLPLESFFFELCEKCWTIYVDKNYYDFHPCVRNEKDTIKRNQTMDSESDSESD